MAKKIAMKNAIVELDGDEMTRIIWKWVKEKLIMPYVDLKTDYYDLHMQHRDKTNDQVTLEAAYAIKVNGVGVKCATITANEDRVKEYNLKEAWKSPNGTIRKILDGTVFRKPITIDTIIPYVPGWKKPITIARHAYGDVYSATGMEVGANTKAELILTDSMHHTIRKTVFEFKEEGVLLAEYNVDSSIRNFAKSCFKYALDEKTDLMFATKDTISKIYDNRFKEIFEEVFKAFEEEFIKMGINYTYTLIDDAVAKIMKSEGGIIWACKNYDGDVMSDMVASGFGSLALMTSVLVSPEGAYEFEAAHGTVKNHYYKYLKGETTSTNPMAIIFAWTGALRKRGEIDHNQELVDFSINLEESAIEIVNEGTLTKDLFQLSSLKDKRWVESEEFLDCIAKRISEKY
ncbi:MAG: NADP-dependent isocitrate dehydrogenase [Tissierellales bacterium]|nr:NADP-dependent isocitrate dehydrogenase [Tissierellales bacterium]